MSVYKTLKANKIRGSLSHILDGTMRDGSHNMKLFGLGFLRSVSSKEQQAHTMASMGLAYKALEDSLQSCNPESRAGKFWMKFSHDFDHKSKQLTTDVIAMGGNKLSLQAGNRYSDRIHAICNEMDIGNDISRGDLLLAHAYVRYLADLFGGSFLGKPTKLALGLEQIPQFYDFPEKIKSNRKEYIESFYEGLNAVGESMSESRKKTLYEEAKLAYKLNADIFTENPYFVYGAVKGGLNLSLGYLRHRVS
jgi:heme oxygenase